MIIDPVFLLQLQHMNNFNHFTLKLQSTISKTSVYWPLCLRLLFFLQPHVFVGSCKVEFMFEDIVSQQTFGIVPLYAFYPSCCMSHFNLCMRCDKCTYKIESPQGRKWKKKVLLLLVRTASVSDSTCLRLDLSAVSFEGMNDQFHQVRRLTSLG